MKKMIFLLAAILLFSIKPVFAASDDFFYTYRDGVITLTDPKAGEHYYLAGYKDGQLIYLQTATGGSGSVQWIVPEELDAEQLKLFSLDENYLPLRPAEEIFPTMEFEKTLTSARVVVNGVVTDCDIHVQDEAWYISRDDAKQAFGDEISNAWRAPYIGLEEYAVAADIYYEQDNVLDAAYFHTYETYQGVDLATFDRAFILGLVEESWKDRADEQISSTDYRAMLTSLVESYAPGKVDFFDEQVTDYKTLMARGDGFLMAYFAAVCLGADTINNRFDQSIIDGGKFWAAPENQMLLFPHMYDKPEGGIYMKNEIFPHVHPTWDSYHIVGYLWACWHSSPLTEEMMFTFDRQNISMDPMEPLTVFDAVCTLTRLYDCVVYNRENIIPLSDERVTAPRADILTEELLAQAKKAPEVTAENHPTWSGLVLGAGYGDSELPCDPELIERFGDWGFNATRIMLNYDVLFNKEITEIDISTLETLDAMVANAIKTNQHLNLAMLTLPGRECYTNLDTYESFGSFDLFLNEEKQELANRLWTVIAHRYRDVPSAYLSFMPFWEPLNSNFSTGLPYEPYTVADAGRYTSEILDVIRAADPDRLTYFECATELEEFWIGNIRDTDILYDYIENKENVLPTFNFCEQPYVYAAMTATGGAHIDHQNRGVRIPSYPTRYYSVSNGISWDTPLTFDGFLPAGTKLNMYVDYHYWSGDLTLAVDGTTVHVESFVGNGEKTFFEREEFLSGYYPFAVSEKKITLTLDQAANVITASVSQGLSVSLCGVEIILPEEYAVEDWYHASTYDVALGLAEKVGPYRKESSVIMIPPNQYQGSTHITIHEDCSYTTDAIWVESNADTMAVWANALKKIANDPLRALIRIESAEFSATTWTSMKTYYTDTLEMCAENGFSWLSNDWRNLTQQHVQKQQIAECPECVPYKEYDSFNTELLKLLQEYQSNERP